MSTQQDKYTRPLQVECRDWDCQRKIPVAWWWRWYLLSLERIVLFCPKCGKDKEFSIVHRKLEEKIKRPSKKLMKTRET